MNLEAGDLSTGQGRKGDTEKRLKGWDFEYDDLSSNPGFFLCLSFFKFNEDNNPH